MDSRKHKKTSEIFLKYSMHFFANAINYKDKLVDLNIIFIISTIKIITIMTALFEFGLSEGLPLIQVSGPIQVIDFGSTLDRDSGLIIPEKLKFFEEMVVDSLDRLKPVIIIKHVKDKVRLAQLKGLQAPGSTMTIDFLLSGLSTHEQTFEIVKGSHGGIWYLQQELDKPPHSMYMPAPIGELLNPDV